MRVWIDQDLCTGDAQCAEICPEVFSMHHDEVGYRAYVRSVGAPSVDPGGAPMLRGRAGVAEVGETTEVEAAVVEAATLCPGECIVIEHARCCIGATQVGGARREGLAAVPSTADQTTELELDLDGRAGHWLLTVAGEIDVATSGDLRRCLAGLEGVVVVDCSSVPFLDASGMGVLAHARTRLAATAGTLTLRHVQPRIERILDIVGLSNLLEPA